MNLLSHRGLGFSQWQQMWMYSCDISHWSSANVSEREVMFTSVWLLETFDTVLNTNTNKHWIIWKICLTKMLLLLQIGGSHFCLKVLSTFYHRRRTWLFIDLYSTEERLKPCLNGFLAGHLWSLVLLYCIYCTWFIYWTTSQWIWQTILYSSKPTCN